MCTPCRGGGPPDREEVVVEVEVAVVEVVVAEVVVLGGGAP